MKQEYCCGWDGGGSKTEVLCLTAEGAVLIAGTGSVCLGRDEMGRTARAGGYGHLIDDGGSGYAIGRDILSAVVRAQDGRGAPTRLAPLVFDHLGIDSVSQLITWLYAPGTGKKEVASLAPLLLRALEADDDAAAQIAHTAAAELAALVLAVFGRLSRTEGELVLSGSILSHYPAIAQEVLSLCAARLPGVRPVPMRSTAAQGAARLALQEAGFSQ